MHAFRRGRTTEDIFRSYPTVGSLANIYGVITFILEHPQEIEEYLQAEERAYQEFQASHPLPTDMLAPFARARNEKLSKLV